MSLMCQQRLAASEKPPNREVDSFEGGYEGTADERAGPLGRVRHASVSADAHGLEWSDSHRCQTDTPPAGHESLESLSSRKDTPIGRASFGACTG